MSTCELAHDPCESCLEPVCEWCRVGAAERSMCIHNTFCVDCAERCGECRQDRADDAAVERSEMGR